MLLSLSDRLNKLLLSEHLPCVGFDFFPVCRMNTAKIKQARPHKRQDKCEQGLHAV